MSVWSIHCIKYTTVLMLHCSSGTFCLRIKTLLGVWRKTHQIFIGDPNWWGTTHQLGYTTKDQVQRQQLQWWHTSSAHTVMWRETRNSDRLQYTGILQDVYMSVYNVSVLSPSTIGLRCYIDPRLVQTVCPMEGIFIHIASFYHLVLTF